MRKGYNSFDLVLKEESTPIMAFLNVMYGMVYKTAGDATFIKKMSMRKNMMKLTYSCYKRGVLMKPLIFNAIN